MPAKTIVEELPPTWTQERNDVLEIRDRACRGTECRRIERASPHREQKDAEHTTADLEPCRVEVLVRHAIACEMQYRSDDYRCEA